MSLSQRDLIELAVFSLAPLSALIFGRQGVKSWIKYEIAASFLFSAFFFGYPQLLFSGIVNNVDFKGYHLFVLAQDGGFIIFAVLAPLFLFESKDERIFTGHLWSRVVANALFTVENLYSYFNTPTWNLKSVYVFSSFSIVCFAISLYYYLKITKEQGKPSYFDDPVNQIAKIESLFILIAGFLLYSFPDFAMLDNKNPDDFHRTISRASGAILASSSFASYSVSEFLHINDKKTFMLSRLVGGLIDLVVIALGCCHFQVLSLQAAAIHLIINFAYNSLVLYGFLITPSHPKSS